MNRGPGAGVVVWVTGLPASGKTTLARRTLDALRARRVPAVLLDGDEVRAALHPTPGYDPEDRAAFYATLAALAALIARQGPVVLVAATAHRRAFREAARAAAPRFVEVWVATPAAECARRDPKRLYARRTPDLPGSTVAYEPPGAPDVVAQGGEDDTALTAIVRLAAGAGASAKQ